MGTNTDKWNETEYYKVNIEFGHTRVITNALGVLILCTLPSSQIYDVALCTSSLCDSNPEMFLLCLSVDLKLVTTLSFLTYSFFLATHRLVFCHTPHPSFIVQPFHTHCIFKLYPFLSLHNASIYKPKLSPHFFCELQKSLAAYWGILI